MTTEERRAAVSECLSNVGLTLIRRWLYLASLRFLVSAFPLLWDEKCLKAATEALNRRSRSGRI